MMTLHRIAASLLLSIAAAAASAQPKPGHLDEVIRQLDVTSAKFKAAEANFKWDLFDHTVKETTSQTGTIYFEKDSAKTRMGAKITSPALKFLEFRNNSFRMYEPLTNHLTTFSAQKNQSQIETFLTLGFGASGKDLLNAWNISDLGNDTVDGVDTAKLDLVPKDPGVRSNYPHIIIWIDPARGVSLKQEIFMASQDTRTSYYTNIHMNQKIDEKQYEIKTNGKTSVDAH